LILDVLVENIQFLLANIYSPNSDRPNCYLNLKNKIEQIYCSQRIVIGGDFNLIFDKDLDSMNYKYLNNPNSRQEVMDELNYDYRRRREKY
jgi:hypothetical protein